MIKKEEICFIITSIVCYFDERKEELMILERVTAKKKLVAEDLILIWEDSVRKTHSFLKEENIAKLRPLVKLAIKNMQTLLIAKEKDGKIMGFIAIENRKIEMLFVKPEYIGKGVGKALLLFAVKNYNVIWVDVNEQNKKALKFYEDMGFVVFCCSKTDSAGNPFPILHMKWNE